MDDPDMLLPGVDINEMGPQTLPWLVIAGAATMLLLQAYRSSSFFVELARRIWA